MNDIVHRSTAPVSRLGFLFFAHLAAILVALIAGGIDAAVTRFLQTERDFTERLLLEAAATHGGLSILIAIVLSGLYLVIPRSLKQRITIAGPFRVAAATIAATYFCIFVGFYYFVDLVAGPAGLARLKTYPSLAFLTLLLISTWVAGRVAHRVLSGTPSARHGIRTTVLSLVLLALGAGTFFAIPELRNAGFGNEAEAASPFKGTGAKNVVLLIMDTTRRDRLSVYGHDLTTSPALEKIAAEGAIFNNASAVASYTLTSHASILTGRLPSQHRATMRTGILDESTNTLAKILKGSGRDTAAFVANRVLRIESGMNQGFDLYDDLVDPEVCHTALWDVVHNAQAVGASLTKKLNFNGRPHWIEDHQRTAEDQNERILEWVEAHRDRPFFLFANYYDPHWPYLPEEPFKSQFAVPYSGPISGFLFRDDDFEKGSELTPEDNDYLLSLYDAEIAYLDHHIGKLVQRFEEMGILDETVLIITSDHGEYFGEHGGYYSHKELYEEALAVPLLIRYPGGVRSGAVIDEPVSLTDIVPTILELVGLEPQADLNGQSLASRLSLAQAEDGQQAEESEAGGDIRTILAEDYDHSRVVRKMARQGAMKLIKSYDAKENEELFDLEIDPREGKNLLARTGEEEGIVEKHPTLPEMLGKLFAAIQALGEEAEGGGSLAQKKPSSDHLDRKAKEALKALGYLE